MSRGRSRPGRVLAFALVAVFAVSCGQPDGPATQTTTDDTTATGEAADVEPLEVTELQSGNLGQGRKGPRIVVSDSLDAPGGESDGQRTSPEIPQGGVAYVAVYRGEKRTGGYSVEVASARREDGEVVVRLELRDPPEGTLVPQVISYPYTVVAVAGAEADGRFVFEDGSGERLDWPVRRDGKK